MLTALEYFLQKTLDRLGISSVRQIEIQGSSIFVDRTVEIFSLTPDLDVSLVYPPRR